MKKKRDKQLRLRVYNVKIVKSNLKLVNAK